MFFWDAAKARLSNFAERVGDASIGLLNFFGLFHEEKKILFMGLDNAGKTTLFRMLVSDELKQYQPTLHPTSEEIRIGRSKLKVFDLGGHASARRAWADYTCKVDGVVFVVDAADQERFEEAKTVLNNVLMDEQLKDVPFVILGNKIDIPTAVNEEDLKSYLSLRYCTTGKTPVDLPEGTRPIEVFMCSIVKRSGYREGLLWLNKFEKV